MNIKEFLFTGFYSGYSPVAPGTAGTLVGMAMYIAENVIFSSVDPVLLNAVNLAVVAILIYPTIKLGDYSETFYNSKDPQTVVIDEVMGYWVSILFIPFSLTNALLAFILFRIFDILKPFPAKSLQSLKGGLGILVDDLIAGAYALAIMHLTVYFFSYNNIILP